MSVRYITVTPVETINNNSTIEEMEDVEEINEDDMICVEQL